MCGIVGYVGPRRAVPILLDGLAKLEYRGYDSAGLAVQEDGIVQIRKSVGRLAKLAELVGPENLAAQVGIGHTRWATHGKPSDENAHPHTDCSGDIAVVHNGIVENYQELRTWLKEQGHTFKSETDTEVIPHLIEEFYQGDLAAAVRQALDKMKGSYAVVVMHRNEPGRLVAARMYSPLVVGVGQGENFVASDIPALLAYTRDVYILDDGEMADLTGPQVNVTDLKGNPVDKKVFQVKWDLAAAEKGGYEDFMIKEIHEQPKAVRDTLSGRVKNNREVALDEVNIPLSVLSRLKKITMVACGTAYHAGLVGKYVMERFLRIPVEVELASEFRYKEPLVDDSTLVIAISQSGETLDTLMAMREAKQRGARVLAITNVVGSSVARSADDVVYTWAGPEIAVASTKAYMTQLIALYLLTAYLGQRRGNMNPSQVEEILTGLMGLEPMVEMVLELEPRIAELAGEFKDKEDLFFIGRGLDYAVAMEGSLKLKEISYIHAEAYPAGELKHGTLALIAPGVPVIALATQPSLYEKTLSNIKEVKAREATVIAVAVQGNESVRETADHVIYLPEVKDFLYPVVTVVPLQLFAYHAAKKRGCDVDKPRNLAKSVTVE